MLSNDQLYVASIADAVRDLAKAIEEIDNKVNELAHQTGIEAAPGPAVEKAVIAARRL
jgi:hypothetical protein